MLNIQRTVCYKRYVDVSTGHALHFIEDVFLDIRHTYDLGSSIIYLKENYINKCLDVNFNYKIPYNIEAGKYEYHVDIVLKINPLITQVISPKHIPFVILNEDGSYPESSPVINPIPIFVSTPE